MAAAIMGPPYWNVMCLVCPLEVFVAETLAATEELEDEPEMEEELELVGVDALELVWGGYGDPTALISNGSEVA